jgi:hypothetical protein
VGWGGMGGVGGGAQHTHASGNMHSQSAGASPACTIRDGDPPQKPKLRTVEGIARDKRLTNVSPGRGDKPPWAMLVP